jgi:hypothetical protein
MSPASCIVWASLVTDGGFICSAAARSPNDGFVRLSIDSSIDAWAGEMPPSEL